MPVKYGAVAVETPWLDRSQAAGYLGLSATAIDLLANRGQLPKYAALGQVRFLKTDLDVVFKPCKGAAK